MDREGSREHLPAVEATVLYGDPSMADAAVDVADPSRDTVIRDAHRIAIRDARPIRDRLSLDHEGFVLARHETQTPLDPAFVQLNLIRQDDSPEINRRYVAELQPVIEAISGADEVIPQTRRIVVRATARAGLATTDPVAPLVHLDYTEGLAERVLDDSLAVLGRDRPAYRRMAIFQTWRVLSAPPQDNMLAICDASSVSLTDSIVLRTRSMSEQNDVRLFRYNPGHRWYYFSAMQPDELLVFKGFDTADPQSMSGAHVAFDLPGNAGANPRVSVEARFIAFYR
jgi:hypothetical protein